jgi:hypothetical protein
MMHDLTYDEGILGIFSDNGSMGIYGAMKFKYDLVKQDLDLIETDGEIEVKFKSWKIPGR